MDPRPLLGCDGWKIIRRFLQVQSELFRWPGMPQVTFAPFPPGAKDECSDLLICTSTKLEKPMFYDPKTEQLGKHFKDKIAERYILEEPTALRPQRSWWSEFWLQWINVRYTTSGSALRWHHWKWRKDAVAIVCLIARAGDEVLKRPERTWKDLKRLERTFDVNHGFSAGCWGRFCLTLRKHHRRAMAEWIRLPQNDGFTNLICPVRPRAMPELAVQRVKGLICLCNTLYSQHFPDDATLRCRPRALY